MGRIVVEWSMTPAEIIDRAMWKCEQEGEDMNPDRFIHWINVYTSPLWKVLNGE